LKPKKFKKIDVIFETDSNNELDDQQAMAYFFFNSSTFNTKTITVNSTYNDGNIEEQYAEAVRIMKLCQVSIKIPFYKGTNKSFQEIEKYLSSSKFEGFEAVDCIISEAKKHTKSKLVVITFGKLTKIALALKKTLLLSKYHAIWLGGNYPDPREYNLENNIPFMNYILETNVDFEKVTVHYDKSYDTDGVNITKEEVLQHLKGVGPKISTPIIGRHGGEFYSLGDYAIDLF